MGKLYYLHRVPRVTVLCVCPCICLSVATLAVSLVGHIFFLRASLRMHQLNGWSLARKNTSSDYSQVFISPVANCSSHVISWRGT